MQDIRPVAFITGATSGMTESEFTLVRMKGDRGIVDHYHQVTRALQPEEIAEQALHIALLPDHVNINRLEVAPLSQHWSALSVKRDDERE